MDNKTDINAVEQRAYKARVRIGEVCDRADVHRSVWSKAKTRGTVAVETLLRMETAMAVIEAERGVA